MYGNIHGRVTLFSLVLSFRDQVSRNYWKKKIMLKRIVRDENGRAKEKGKAEYVFGAGETERKYITLHPNTGRKATSRISLDKHSGQYRRRDANIVDDHKCQQYRKHMLDFLSGALRSESG